MLNLLFYGTVGDKDEGLDAVTIRTRIEESDGPIAARFNSGGGYVLEGMAIIKALQDAQAAGRKVTVYIDGLAASMASVIAMVGDEVIIAENAMIMIHNPFQVAIGDANKLRQTADVLDKIRDQLLAIYAKRTGLSAKVLTAMMNAETWMNATEAMENRFVTSIADSSTAKAEVKPIDISAFGFNHVPQSPLILNHTPITPPGSPAPGAVRWVSASRGPAPPVTWPASSAAMFSAEPTGRADASTSSPSPSSACARSMASSSSSTSRSSRRKWRRR